MKIFLITLLISTLFLASCSKPEVSEKKSFQTYSVSTGAVVETDRILATIEGKSSADIAFKTSGRIATLLASPGDIVKK
jgi:multidrug efflux pump subunit AcrA (membrane-fusion protein)